jgi:hypothetical protein
VDDEPAQPNGFLVPVCEDAATDSGTFTCVLHEVHRIVLPASLSGTSNAAEQPEQVIAIGMGSST